MLLKSNLCSIYQAIDRIQTTKFIESATQILYYIEFCFE
ncbi:hypothetical protein HC081234_11280 [Helicobacter cinaedi]|nr:hypothetical protein HC081234_11280 [Helicobacter cinaedi]